MLILSNQQDVFFFDLKFIWLIKHCLNKRFYLKFQWRNKAMCQLSFKNVAQIMLTDASYEPRHNKTNKMSVRPAKTQISLGIRPVWSESSLSAWRNLGSLATHWAHSEDWSDWADALADLSFRWTHTHFCWSCHVVAHMRRLLPHSEQNLSWNMTARDMYTIAVSKHLTITITKVCKYTQTTKLKTAVCQSV